MTLHHDTAPPGSMPCVSPSFAIGRVLMDGTWGLGEEDVQMGRGDGVTEVAEGMYREAG